jgi:DNA-binding response OmpR family regulator
MNSTCNKPGTSTPVTPKRPAKRVLVATRFPLAREVADRFRALGWEVHTAAVGDLHAAVAGSDPHAVLVPEAAGDESGYLACAKLRASRPRVKMAVLGRERTARRERLAAFVGASFVTEADGVGELIAAVS